MSAMWVAVTGWSGLMWELARTDLVNRYRGSVLSFAWMALVPLAMVAVYTSAFLGILRLRTLETQDNSPLTFGLHLYAGLLIHGFLAEILGRAPGCVREQANLVKKVVFPLSVLPLVPVISAGARQAAGLCILIGALVVSQGVVHLAWLWLVPVIVLLVMLVAGVSYLLAAVGTYLPDIGHATGLLTAALLFLSPIFYPLDAAEGPWALLIRCNPIAIPIEMFRNIILGGVAPSAGHLAYAVLTSAASLLSGLWLFARVRQGFCDVL